MTARVCSVLCNISLKNNKVNMNKKQSSDEVLPRKRGRPAGKNRVPLSITERRARNAQYEKERRVEMADALAELAEAAGCESTISNSDLLATVISQLQHATQMKHSSDVDSLRRCNKNLMAQIVTLEKRLAGDPGAAFSRIKDEDEPCYGKRKRHVYEEPHAVACTSLIQRPEDSPSGAYSSPESFPEQKYEASPQLSPAQVVEPEIHLTEPKYSPEQKFIPEAHYFSTDHPAAETTSCLPVPKLSPLSNSSDCYSPDQSVVDYSSYQFAGAQIPTPEYQITVDPPDYIVTEPRYYQIPRYGGHPLPSVQHSPGTQSMVSELQYPAPYICPPLPNFQASHQNIDEPVEDQFILPDTQDSASSPQIDQRQMRFLSTEDLISVYL